MQKWVKNFLGMSHVTFATFFYFKTFSFWYFQDPVFRVDFFKIAKKQGIRSTKRKKF